MSVYLEPYPRISYLVGKTSGKGCVFDMGCGCWERARLETLKDGGNGKKETSWRNSYINDERRTRTSTLFRIVHNPEFKTDAPREFQVLDG
jgi:hypothetical protein